ncbi:MAG TPA: VIT1/CCC1 transporter family protein [bacterium]|jgi:VIT1/CCC1 family predicted Fe2+/Mn2+ transporter|nr:VIT1/CCC1 transporter family protein [bacterium]
MILGGQDGLVNVLGVVLGATAATSEARVILSIGLAATFAESLAMGAVAYTSFKAEKEHYDSELAREKAEIRDVPEREREEIRDIYRKKGFQGELLEKVVEQICSDEAVWLEVMMTEELGLKPLGADGVAKTAFSVGLSCMVGSLVPLAPYFFLPVGQGLWAAVACSALVLFVMGFYKAKVTIGNYWRSATELTVIGLCAALAGYGISLAMNHLFLAGR